MLQKTVGIISGSFWFTPSLMIATGILSAYFLPLIEAEKLTSFLNDYRLAVSDVNAASQIVQGIATSVITITSIAFSMTIVALIMASSQFGPRLLKNFMKNKLTQFALGIFTSTFVFCIVLLSQISNQHQGSVHPELSVLVSEVFALICVMVLIFFIHHVATSIRADSVVKQTADSLMKDMQKLQDQKHRIAHYDSLIELDNYNNVASITSDCDGYIQAIEFDQIAELAVNYKGLLKMHVRAGQYIIEGAKVATLYSPELIPNNLSIDDCIVVGAERTSLQDPLFAINQLVEMALRALSPSLNDPFTATNCIDRLSSALGSFSANTLPETIILVDKTPRVFTCDASFLELFDGAFTQIRQSSQSHHFVLLHLLGTFRLLLESSACAPHIVQAVSLQLSSVKESVSNSAEPMCSLDKNNYLQSVQAIESYL